MTLEVWTGDVTLGEWTCDIRGDGQDTFLGWFCDFIGDGQVVLWGLGR